MTSAPAFPRDAVDLRARMHILDADREGTRAALAEARTRCAVALVAGTAAPEAAAADAASVRELTEREAGLTTALALAAAELPDAEARERVAVRAAAAKAAARALRDADATDRALDDVVHELAPGLVDRLRARNAAWQRAQAAHDAAQRLAEPNPHGWGPLDAWPFGERPALGDPPNLPLRAGLLVALGLQAEALLARYPERAAPSPD